MARPGKDSTRIRSDDELHQRFDEGLTTIQTLSRIFDDGHTAIAGNLCVEIYTLLTGNSAKVLPRYYPLSFASPDDPPEQNDRQVAPYYRLCGWLVTDIPNVTVTSVPFFKLDHPSVLSIDFDQWWKKEIIYRESGIVPEDMKYLPLISKSRSVPIIDRKQLSRQSLVHMLRNKIGAHSSDEWPIVLDEISSFSRSAIVLVLQSVGRYRPDDDNCNRFIVDPLLASVRQIAHEMLLAFGRTDAPGLATS